MTAATQPLMAVSNTLLMTRRGWDDLVQGLVSWRIWHLMGTSTIRRRYSRSRVGQFWTTITTAVMSVVMGFTWSILWHLPLGDILPFITGSLILWGFLTGSIQDSTNVMITSGHYFLNQGMSFSTPIYALVYCQLITLLHNMIIIVVILIIFPPSLGLDVLLFIPGFLLTLITVFWVSCVVSVFCARYRDVIQLVATVLTTAMYVTPVMFKPDFIPKEYQWINMINPFAVFLSIIRDPLFGREVPWENWVIASAITVVGAVLTLSFIGRFRKRVIYWI